MSFNVIYSTNFNRHFWVKFNLKIEQIDGIVNFNNQIMFFTTQRVKPSQKQMRNVDFSYYGIN